jgi:hypothetical protein
MRDNAADRSGSPIEPMLNLAAQIEQEVRDLEAVVLSD